MEAGLKLAGTLKRIRLFGRTSKDCGAIGDGTSTLNSPASGEESPRGDL